MKIRMLHSISGRTDGVELRAGREFTEADLNPVIMAHLLQLDFDAGRHQKYAELVEDEPEAEVAPEVEEAPVLETAEAAPPPRNAARRTTKPRGRPRKAS